MGAPAWSPQGWARSKGGHDSSHSPEHAAPTCPAPCNVPELPGECHSTLWLGDEKDAPTPGQGQAGQSPRSSVPVLPHRGVRSECLVPSTATPRLRASTEPLLMLKPPPHILAATREGQRHQPRVRGQGAKPLTSLWP